MALDTFIDEMRTQRRTVTVYSDRSHPDLRERFADWNVELRFERLPPEADESFVTVRRGGEFLGGVDIDALGAFFESETVPPWQSRRSGVDPEAFMELLDETLFQADGRRQLLAASREFEDRAWRVGGGRIDAGFQRPGAFRAQRAVYERLAERGLDVHVYFDGGWDLDTVEGVTTHTTHDGELGRYWFVAFDTPDTIDRSQACALLAEETSPDSYTGFWTYDANRVADLVEYLAAAYG